MTTAHDTRIDACVVALRSALPAGTVITDPDVTASYTRDQSRLTDAEPPAAVLIPRNTAEVSTCLRLACEHGVPVIARGAGSGLSGAANASGNAVVLSLHRMNAVLEIDEINRVAVVQPGVITADLRAAVATAGLFYPPDPGSVAFCTIGGNVATNAGGMCCVRYGVTGDFVLGMEVVLADGRVLRTGRRTVKGVAGYDLTRLFVGSEGTLGIVTEVTLRLVPAPDPRIPSSQRSRSWRTPAARSAESSAPGWCPACSRSWTGQPCVRWMHWRTWISVPMSPPCYWCSATPATWNR